MDQYNYTEPEHEEILPEQTAVVSENAVPPKKKKHIGRTIALIAIPCALILALITGTAALGVYAIKAYTSSYGTNISQNGNGGGDTSNSDTASTLASSDSSESSSSLLSTTTTQAAADDIDLADTVENILPSVVCINITTEIVYSQFGQQYSGQTSTGSGSGVIISQDDDNIYIVTNNHVVSEDSSTSSSYYYYYFSTTDAVITVVFADGTECTATLRGTDEENDLAVIAVPISSLSSDTVNSIKIATIGNSDEIRLGETAIAIGNALGYGQSVTRGIISALDREVTFSDGYTRTLIQTDAAINPGNSGGGLFNASGELIGINSAKYADTDVEGIGYAIPISNVTDLILELIQYQQRETLSASEQGFLGVSGQDITSDLASVYGMPVGVYVTKVVSDSAAEKYGVQAKDIITKVENTSITSTTQLTEVIKTYAVGETVTITLSRLENGEYVEKEIEVVLDSREEYENSLNEGTIRK